jgi:RNA polymerase sigma factor (sigma-70 family)
LTEEALGRLLQEHLPKVHRALWRLTSDEQLAWDCTNQAAIRLINENRKKSELTKPITWLMVVARRIALDHFKSAYSRHESTVGAHADDFPAVGTTPWSPRTHSDLVAEVEFNDFLQRIRTQIGNKHDAQIWEMRAIWEFPGREVAEALGISEATVSRRYRAACEKATGDPWDPKATPLDLTRLVLVSEARKATPSAPPGRATSHPNTRTTQSKIETNQKVHRQQGAKQKKQGNTCGFQTNCLHWGV